ncbi:MAG: hypothetical protein ABH878_01920 [bacterium]
MARRTGLAVALSPKPIKQEARNRGLCVSCEHQENCKFRIDPEKTVVFCEEFELKMEPMISITEASSVPVEKIETNPAEEVKLYKGLCANCENRQNCIFPQPAGGVWHCEEYL